MFDTKMIVENFVLNDKPEESLIGKYASKVPSEILHLWKDLGFGSLLDGYLKIINPELYKYTVLDGFELATDSSIALFATAMADLLVYHNNYLYFLDFRHNSFEVVSKNLRFFFQDIFDESFLVSDLKWKPYKEAKEKLGVPAFDECFGYEPILAAGGSEKVDNLKKVNIKEHISIITQFAGKI